MEYEVAKQGGGEKYQQETQDGHGEISREKAEEKGFFFTSR